MVLEGDKPCPTGREHCSSMFRALSDLSLCLSLFLSFSWPVLICILRNKTVIISRALPESLSHSSELSNLRGSGLHRFVAYWSEVCVAWEHQNRQLVSDVLAVLSRTMLSACGVCRNSRQGSSCVAPWQTLSVGLCPDTHIALRYYCV